MTVGAAAPTPSTCCHRAATTATNSVSNPRSRRSRGSQRPWQPTVCSRSFSNMGRRRVGGREDPLSESIKNVDKLYDFNKTTIGPDKAKLKVGTVLKLPEPPTVK